MFRRIPSCLAALLVLTPVSALAMRVEIPFDPALTCFDARSPKIVLRDVPIGTVELKVRIKNLSDFPGTSSKTLAYAGEDRIAKGAIRHFAACRAFGRWGRDGGAIEVRVQARDASGKVLASARDDAFLRDR
jgi:hypothetical protein